MAGYSPLTTEYRGGVEDLVHLGYLAVVDERGEIVLSVGDPNAVVFYRSASKPIQALPVIARGLDRRYGLTDEETAIFAASHHAEPFHIAALESILRKTGLREEDMIMLPATPHAPYAEEARVREGRPPRKLYHNCSGKHAALMLLERDLTGDVRGYEDPDSPAQREVMRAVRLLSEVDALGMGLDGCGVPVFAVPIKHIAAAFRNLACPDLIPDEVYAAAARAFVPRMHEYPYMIQGKGTLCEALNADPDIVAKGGANGLYCFALKRERLGITFKLIDGTADSRPLIVRETLKKLGCLSAETEKRIEALSPEAIINDCGQIVGRRTLAFLS